MTCISRIRYGFCGFILVIMLTSYSGRMERAAAGGLEAFG